jgi:hydroxymethylglutaryl-CoA synthase
VDDSLNKFLELPEEETYGNRELDKICNAIADYDNKVLPSTRLGREIGNIYTGSLYAGLMSLVEEKGKDLANERAVLFSYGSGSAATMFSTTFRGESELQRLKEMGDVDRILQSREEVDPEEFTETLKQREQVYGTYPIQVPKSERMRPGAYYLKSVDDLGRRQYARAYSTMRKVGRRVLRR